ncbi:hypothetical protein J3A83DRAFT_2697727 [Scleroderma citrinum]
MPSSVGVGECLLLSILLLWAVLTWVMLCPNIRQLDVMWCLSFSGKVGRIIVHYSNRWNGTDKRRTKTVNCMAIFLSVCGTAIATLSLSSPCIPHDI